MIQHLEHLSQIFKGARMTLELDEKDYESIFISSMGINGSTITLGKNFNSENRIVSSSTTDELNFILNSTEFIIKKKV